MANLLKMDLYRMRKEKTFWVCLILAFVLAFVSTPIDQLFIMLGNQIADEALSVPEAFKLSDFIRTPLPSLNAMLCLISICTFYYADVEHGYVKNIAGQVPRRGDAIISKFLAALPHNLIFMAAGIVGNFIGTFPFREIVVDGAIPESIRIFIMKLLCLQSICAILLLFVGALRYKSAGTALAVVYGMDLLMFVYWGIDSGLDNLFPSKNFDISNYMPDQLLSSSDPKTSTVLIVSAVTIALFLGLAVKIFEKRDVN